MNCPVCQSSRLVAGSVQCHECGHHLSAPEQERLEFELYAKVRRGVNRSVSALEWGGVDR